MVLPRITKTLHIMPYRTLTEHQVRDVSLEKKQHVDSIVNASKKCGGSIQDFFLNFTMVPYSLNFAKGERLKITVFKVVIMRGDKNLLAFVLNFCKTFSKTSFWSTLFKSNQPN